MEWFTRPYYIMVPESDSTCNSVFMLLVSILALQRAELAYFIIVPFPSPCWKLRGFFSPIFTARPWETPWVNLTQVWKLPWLGPPGVQPPYLSALGLQRSVSQSPGFLPPPFPWRCLLGGLRPSKLSFWLPTAPVFHADACPVTSLLWRTWAVDSSVSSAFYLLRQGGDF